MIGDGISDLEAVEATGGADIFICYGKIIGKPIKARFLYTVFMVAAWAWQDKQVACKLCCRPTSILDALESESNKGELIMVDMCIVEELAIVCFISPTTIFVYTGL